MKKYRFPLIAAGVFCVLASLASAWYSLAWNDGRLVYPTDFSTYRFCLNDLPVILSVVLLSLYVVVLIVLLARAAFRTRQEEQRSNTTRALNPKLGFLGFLGLLGFVGFWTYSVNKTVFPFCFFSFFGFFGFFFEGKLSGILMDERFRENQQRADLNAYQFGCTITFILLILLGRGTLMGNLEYTLIFLMIALSLTMALVLFLSRYLLYRYDHAGQPEEEEDGHGGV